MITKIPVSAIGTGASLFVALSGDERSVLLSAITSYNDTLFFVDSNNKVVTDNDSYDEVIESIIAKLSGVTMNANAYTVNDKPIADNTLLGFNFDGFSGDPRMFDAGNPDRLIAPEDGHYLITLILGWQGNATGTRYTSVYVHQSAGNEYPIVGSRNLASSTSLMQVSISTVLEMAKDQYIYPQVRQNSGVSLDIVARAYDSARMTMTRVQ